MNNFMSLDKKLELWESRLSQNELLLLTHAIQKETTNLVEKKMEAINATIQTSIAAALILNNDMAIKEIEEMFDKSNELIEDAQSYLSVLKEEYIMVIDKMEPKIKEKIVQMLNAGKSQIQIIGTLSKEFKVPNQNLIVIYQKTKEEWIKPSIQLTAEDKRKNVEMNKKYLEATKKNKEIKNKANTEEKEVSKVNVPKKEIESSDKVSDRQNEEIKSKFKVVKQEIVLEGEFGTYKKSEEGVEAGKLKFIDVEEVDKYEQAEQDKADKQLQAILDELDKQKRQAIKEHDEEIAEFRNKTEEIKAVFAY